MHRRSDAPADPAADPGTDARLALLRSPATHGLPPDSPVESIETHMAWVFLAGRFALKLKKPVRYPFLDFSTTDARERACREELRLNVRLAPGIYVGLDTLRWDGRTLALAPESAPVGDARVVDWVVRMRRLPRERMLDALVARGAVATADVDAIADRLAAFYRTAPSPPDGERYLARFADEQAANRDVLARPGLAPPQAADALDRFDRALGAYAGRLRARAVHRRVVDGHGDLRAEHVCMLDDAPVVIDAIEFNAELRRCDPFDEIALLGVECEVLGAPWIGPRLADRLAGALDDPEGAALVPFYRAWRALLRARLSLAHLLEPSPRAPLRWAPQAARFVEVARQALDAVEAA